MATQIAASTRNLFDRMHFKFGITTVERSDLGGFDIYHASTGKLLFNAPDEKFALAFYMGYLSRIEVTL